MHQRHTAERTPSQCCRRRCVLIAKKNPSRRTSHPASSNSLGSPGTRQIACRCAHCQDHGSGPVGLRRRHRFQRPVKRYSTRRLLHTQVRAESQRLFPASHPSTLTGDAVAKSRVVPPRRWSARRRKTCPKNWAAPAGTGGERRSVPCGTGADNDHVANGGGGAVMDRRGGHASRVRQILRQRTPA